MSELANIQDMNENKATYQKKGQIKIKNSKTDRRIRNKSA